MSYQEPDFCGDDVFSVNATGNACAGDVVKFQRAIFSGSYRHAKFSHFETIEAEIVADSYGAAKQQHTFTLRLADGSTIRIKGRNLYRNGLWRKPWTDEAKRLAALAEKYTRGNAARRERNQRKEESL